MTSFSPLRFTLIPEPSHNFFLHVSHWYITSALDHVRKKEDWLQGVGLLALYEAELLLTKARGHAWRVTVGFLGECLYACANSIGLSRKQLLLKEKEEEGRGKGLPK